MANFCPICKANCDKRCGLYDNASQRCGVLSLAVEADAVSGLLADLRNSTDEVSSRIDSLVCEVDDLASTILEK